MNTVIGVLAGLVIAMAVVAGVEMLGHTLYPPPANLDKSDIESVRQMLREAPPIVFVFPLLAWVLGAFIGGFLSHQVSKKPLAAWIVAAVVLLMSAINLVMLPHPVWVAPSAVVLIALSGWLAGMMGKRGG